MAIDLLVSVVIPTYNRQALLRLAIQSVRDQSYTNWELLIVDDGSTEPIGALVASYADARLTYLRQPNQGVSAARNLGARHAKGDYVAFLDSDDMYERDCLRLKVALADQRPDSSVIGGGCRYVDARGVPTLSPTVARASTTYEDLAVFTAFPGGTGNIFVRRDHLERVGGFTQHLTESEDRELLQRLVQVAPVESVREVVLVQRVHPELRVNRDVTAMSASRRWIRGNITSRKLRRKAEAWDEFTIGVRCWAAGARRDAAAHWLRSFARHPSRIHRELKRLPALLERVLPRRAYALIDSAYASIKPLLGRRGLERS